MSVGQEGKTTDTIPLVHTGQAPQYADLCDAMAAGAAEQMQADGYCLPAVTIADVGPVEQLLIPVPADGGIVVLRGCNGSGKTQSLAAVQSLIRGNGALVNRDGTLRGQVEGFGAKITVARSTRRTGELECVSLEGRIDIAALVDPGQKDPAAADARRIKALASLTGAKADPAAFYDLVGGKDRFDEAVKPSSVETDDLVDMAAKIKRDLETEARRYESLADTQGGKAKGLREAADGVDVEAECDGEQLQAALEQAIKAETSLAARRTNSDNALTMAADAQRKIEVAKSRDGVPSFYDASRTLELAANAKLLAVSEFDRLTSELSRARQTVEARQREWEAAESASRAARNHAELIANWQSTIDLAANVERPGDAELNAAVSAVTGARVALERGANIRRAKQQISEAVAHEEDAAALRADSIRLREAAKSTDDVLSQAVACETLRVEGGRLVTTTKRGATYFAELSHGERWRIALDIAADRVGVGGLVVVPQEAWESLDPDNRRMVAEHAKTRRVVILTAEADAGELRAEVFSSNAA